MRIAERRRTSRYPFVLEVTLVVAGGGRRLTGRSADLSKSGIFVRLAATVAEGRRVELLIRSERLGINVATQGTVVHSLAGFGVGIRFASQSARTRENI